MRTITIKDGPLKGTTVDVPEHLESFTTHADQTGHYVLTDSGCRWVKPVAEKPMSRPRQAPRARTARDKPAPVAEPTIEEAPTSPEG